ncbi:MAG: hypothetical protein ACXVCP_14245 [Bdellovibrio sp.]
MPLKKVSTFFGYSVVLIFFSETVHARAVPLNLRDGNARFFSRALGSACYTMDGLGRGLPCNPAAIAKQNNKRLDADLFLGSNAEYIKDAEEILNGNDNESKVSQFFSRRDSIESELSVGASFRASTWGISFEPYRLIAVTRFENPALPMVDLVLAQEQNTKGQIASYCKDNFYLGLQARYSHVRFINQYFALSEAFVSSKKDLLNPQTQELFFLEPGLLYAREDLDWKPQISAVLAQWGFTDTKTEAYPIQPKGLLGASVKPLIPLGQLELGLQLQVDSQTENFSDAYRVAMTYQFEFWQTVLSLSEKNHSFGFFSDYKYFSSGLSFWSQHDNSSVFLSIGFTL